MIGRAACFWTSRSNIVKMAALPKLIHRFDEIPISMPASCFTYLREKKYSARIHPEPGKTTVGTAIPRSKNGGLNSV